jgi:hypothetical protein
MSSQHKNSFLSGSDIPSLEKLPNGIAAYLYGYPLVITGVTEQRSTNSVATPSSGAAPINQFGKQLEFPSVEFAAVVLPSTSTLYNSAFLNLHKEPIILHLPDFGDRFFQMPILDGWTNVNPDSPSTRMESPEGEYVIVGPNDNRDYSGEGRMVIKMATETAWIVGRVFSDGTDKDLAYINEKLYPYLTLTPWSKRNDKDYQPPTDLPFDPFVALFSNPNVSIQEMNAATFFTKLAAMMNYNAPILPQDEKMVARLKEIGFSFDDGVSFEYAKLSEEAQANLEKEVEQAKKYLEVRPIDKEVITTGWSFPTEESLANYGDEYGYRAKIARWALGANPVPDVVYGYAKGDYLHGDNTYSLTFDTLPPVSSKAFWSVTIYNSDGTLVYNEEAEKAGVKYNAIGVPNVQDHTPFLTNDDTSITLHLQSMPPEDRNSPEFQNWLPIPLVEDSLGSKNFIVFLRMYIADLEIQEDGDYVIEKGHYVLKDNWFPGEIKQKS